MGVSDSGAQYFGALAASRNFQVSILRREIFFFFFFLRREILYGGGISQIEGACSGDAGQVGGRQVLFTSQINSGFH